MVLMFANFSAGKLYKETISFLGFCSDSLDRNKNRNKFWDFREQSVSDHKSLQVPQVLQAATT